MNKKEVMASTDEREVDLKSLRRILKSTLVSKRATFSDLLTGSSLNKFAEQMYQAHLITDVQQDYGLIVKSFKTQMDLLHTLNDLEDHCRKFLNALKEVGGPLETVAEELEKSWIDDVKTSLHIDFVISRSQPVSDFTDTSFHTIHVPNLQQPHIFPEHVYYYIPVLSHNFNNALRNNPQFRQNIITKPKYRVQSGMRMLAEPIPSSKSARRHSDVPDPPHYLSEATQSEHQDNDPHFATSARKIPVPVASTRGNYVHCHSDPSWMDRGSSMLPSIPEEDTLIEPSQPSTEVTNTITNEQGVQRPLENTPISRQQHNSRTFTGTPHTSPLTVQTENDTSIINARDHEMVANQSTLPSAVNTDRLTNSVYLQKEIDNLRSRVSQLEKQMQKISSENELKEKNGQSLQLNIIIIGLFVLCLIVSLK